MEARDEDLPIRNCKLVVRVGVLEVDISGVNTHQDLRHGPGCVAYGRQLIELDGEQADACLLPGGPRQTENHGGPGIFAVDLRGLRQPQKLPRPLL